MYTARLLCLDWIRCFLCERSELSSHVLFRFDDALNMSTSTRTHGKHEQTIAESTNVTHPTGQRTPETTPEIWKYHSYGFVGCWPGGLLDL